MTGEQVPDETARIPAWRYINPRPAEWPAADFVVGNPPFIGNKRMRAALGDGYVDTLRQTMGKTVPDSADYVMYWWSKAAQVTTGGQVQRFGLITTNSITQPFNRQVIQSFIESPNPFSLVYAVPDHPWVDTAEGAAVRIAMTVGQLGTFPGVLQTVTGEALESDGIIEVQLRTREGRISAGLTIGVDTATALPLRANERLSSQGVTPLGTGFRLERRELADLGFDVNRLPSAVRPYLIGRDLMQRYEEKYIIDFYGLDRNVAQRLYPSLMQRVIDTVLPEREQKQRESYRQKWWIFAEARSMLRAALADVSRYIATCRTAKHRLFIFLDAQTIPDAKIVAIALSDAYALAVLSSRIHVLWAIRTGAWLGVGNDSNYNHSDCFGKFPFPAATDAQKARIRGLAEELDAHRKRQQAQHPKLTLTGMYNVLEKLRAGEALSKAEKVTHEQGLVSVLRQLHDEIDAAVFDAYGWPASLTGEEILARLVALNAERAAEEARGVVRWLRPEYQAPLAAAAGPAPAEVEDDYDESAPAPTTPPTAPALRDWPAGPAEQAAAVRAALAELGRPATPEEVAAAFDAAPAPRIGEWLAVLAALGQARADEAGRFAAG